MIEMNIKIDSDNVIIENEYISLKIYKKFSKVNEEKLVLFFKDSALKTIKKCRVEKLTSSYDEFIIVEFNDKNTDLDQIINDFENDKSNVNVNLIKAILSVFNYRLEAKKELTKKKQYRFVKSVSQMEFTTDYLNTSATIIWQNRNEVLLKKGAVLMTQVPLNKDGTKGFAVKMAEQLRQMNSSFIKDNKTTDDIILKSINEVGLFIYFGGTNSWLQFKNSDGITIDEICGK